MCPILIRVRVRYVGVRATVATAYEDRSMMSPGSGRQVEDFAVDLAGEQRSSSRSRRG